MQEQSQRITKDEDINGIKQGLSLIRVKRFLES